MADDLHLSSASVATPASDATVNPRLSLALVILGGVGLLAAFALTLERLAILANPDHVPSCTLNPILSCSSVMTSPEASVLGFPNPLIGVVAFPFVIATGAALLAGARLARWYWIGLQVGVSLAVVFVHWLIWVSLYEIGALCPYCMAVWTATIPLFVVVTQRNLRQLPGGASSRWTRMGTWLHTYRAPVLVGWFLLVATLIAVRFWAYWITLLA